MKKLTVNLKDETYNLIKENKCNIRKKRVIIDVLLEQAFYILNQLNPKSMIEVGVRVEINEYEK